MAGMIPGMGLILIVIALIVAAFVGFHNTAVIVLIVFGAILALLTAIANS